MEEGKGGTKGEGRRKGGKEEGNSGRGDRGRKKGEDEGRRKVRGKGEKGMEKGGRERGKEDFAKTKPKKYLLEGSGICCSTPIEP